MVARNDRGLPLDEEREHVGWLRAVPDRVPADPQRIHRPHLGAAGLNRDELRVAAPRLEESRTRLDLDDRVIAERSDGLQNLVIAEHGAREEHTGEAAIDRPARLLETRDAARETALHARRARA